MSEKKDKNTDGVAIFARDGEVLCRIAQPRPTAWKFVFLGEREVWKHPEAVVRWAWMQAYVANLAFGTVAALGHGIAGVTCECLMCRENTFTPMAKRTDDKTLAGYACLNKKCKMYRVVLPNTVVEVPFNRIPERYVEEITRLAAEMNATQ